MNSNKNQTNNMNKSDSLSLDLENLQKRYSNLLIEYKQSVTDYINYLNQNNKTKTKKLILMKGQAYLGTETLRQIDNTSVNNCQALCANDSKCSGATFKSNTCVLITGDSSTISSTNDSYAIIPEGKKLLMNMESLNQELINVNEKISNKLNGLQPMFNENDVERKNNTRELIQNYKELIEERENILKLLDDYKTLDNTQQEYEVKITQNYYLYIVYFILAIIIVYFLYKLSYPSPSSNIQYGGELGVNTYYIIFFIILLLMFVRYTIK